MNKPCFYHKAHKGHKETSRKSPYNVVSFNFVFFVSFVVIRVIEEKIC